MSNKNNEHNKQKIYMNNRILDTTIYKINIYKFLHKLLITSPVDQKCIFLQKKM